MYARATADIILTFTTFSSCFLAAPYTHGKDMIYILLGSAYLSHALFLIFHNHPSTIGILEIKVHLQYSSF